MDREAVIQYERKLRKEIEDKKVFDSIVLLQVCDDYELRKKYQYDLVKLLISKDYTVENLPEFPIDLAIKLLIRADLETSIPKITPEELSLEYAKTIQEPQDNSKNFLDRHYQLSLKSSDSWKIIYQFTSFQKISNHIAKKLSVKQINPNVVKNMNVADCLHFISKNCKSAFKEYSLKKKFVQTFIHHNEEELRKMHHLQGVDVRYTDAMVAAMKNDGISCGIQVFDEKGDKIKGPEYTIHHRIPVKHAGEVKYFSEVNLFKNLVLVEKDIYHKLIHTCESSEYVANKRYFSKLLPPANSCLISGLESKDVIYYDFQNKTKIKNPILEAVNLPVQKQAYYTTCSKNDKPSVIHSTTSKALKMVYKNRGNRRG